MVRSDWPRVRSACSPAPRQNIFPSTLGQVPTIRPMLTMTR